MINHNNRKKFLQLRHDYPYFIYEDYKILRENDQIRLEFIFNLSDKYYFTPCIIIPEKDIFKSDILKNSILDNIVFHIGMVEMISYWKSACSPNIIIKPYSLNSAQISWWKNLFKAGLGEFFYMNNLLPLEDDFVEFQSGNTYLPEKVSYLLDEAYIIPVGGGKDSAVTLEMLSDQVRRPLVLNPRRATVDVLKNAGLYSKDIIEIKRKIHPQLLELNQKGFLNGHTPFSALVAFTGLLGAILSGSQKIALSNESSANEPTIPGTDINHQYSKSYEFENNFRSYYKEYISEDINYFSLLRPLNEIQIASIFSRYPKYFQDFKSCNVGSKNDVWCGKCAKCLFTYIILFPFLDKKTMIDIFGTDLLNDPALTEIFDQLTGIANIKPFECVGTLDEVNAAINTILAKNKNSLPILLDRYTKYSKSGSISETKITDLLENINSDHFLNKKEVIKLKMILYG